MDWFDNWALTLAVFIPIVGMVIVLLIPKAEENLIKVVTLLATLLTGAVGIGILANFNLDDGHLQFVANERWIDVIHSRYHVGIDGISLPLVLLTMLVTVCCVVYSWNHFPEPHNPKAFLALVLLLETGMIGTFVAQDLILFFIFFEIVLLPLFFMSRVHTFNMVTLSRLHGDGIVHSTQLLVFAGMFLGFAIKVPMFPFHTWLPDAHTEAPTVGSVLLAAIMLKLGTYGFIRIALPMLPEAAKSWAPWIGLLAVIGIIYGALGCLAQKDMKRLIAFSSVAHMGFVMLGIATLTPFGFNAAIFGMVAHGLITGMLFFLAGSVQHNFHTREMSRLGGLLLQAPKMGWILGFCVMASLGLPGLAGFWGEFPAILAAFQPASPLSAPVFRTFMVVAAVGTVFAAGYLLWMLQKVAFGVPKAEFEHEHIHDVSTFEWTAWVPMLALIVALGLFPNIVFHVTDGAVTHAT